MNEDIKSTEKHFLTSLFKELNGNSILYAVLRNAENLPNTLNGGDVDVLFSTDHFESGYAVITKVARECGGSIVARVDSPHFRQVMILGCYESVWWAVCLDLFSGVCYKAAMPMVSNTILDNRIMNEGGVYTLPDELGAILGVIKELTYNGTLSERYREKALSGIDYLDSKSFAFMRRTQSEILKSLLHDGGNVADKARAFRRAMFLAAARSSLGILVLESWRFNWSKIARWFNPPGIMIAVLGTDGAGKSTILNELEPVLRTLTHRSLVIHHLKPDLLPPLARLRGVKESQIGPVTDPHASKPSGRMGSLFRLAYLLSDYVLGFWFKVRLRLAKVPVGIWIFDRYVYDIMFDPRRFRIRLPAWILKMFVGLAPRPDLILCLGSEPQVIHSRKPEIAFAEAERQIAALQSFCVKRKNAVWIDTGKPIEQSVDEALKAIQTLMSQRFENVN